MRLSSLGARQWAAPQHAPGIRKSREKTGFIGLCQLGLVYHWRLYAPQIVAYVALDDQTIADTSKAPVYRAWRSDQAHINGSRSFGSPFSFPFVLPEHQDDYDASPLVGAALESWADPELAVSFLDDLMNYALDRSVTVHRRVSATWRDRSKADAFVSYARQCQDEYDQHPHVDLHGEPLQG